MCNIELHKKIQPMKIALSIIIMSLFSSISQAQTCDFNYSSSIILAPKDRVKSQEQIKKANDNIESYKYCITQTKDSTELFWLNNAIAFHLSEIHPESESIAKHASKAYQYNKENLCKDYIRIYVYHERDTTFPMKRHYLDQINTAEIEEIRTYCIDNYKEAEMKIYTDKEETDANQKSAKTFNQDYFDALKAISDDDQKERKKKEINWKHQSHLDSLNRIKLDSLFLKYGFPTNDLVSDEGVGNAFLVLHHSQDCVWNEKWTRLFLKHRDEFSLGKIFSFYFYRNFNADDGVCKTNTRFIDELKNNDSTKSYMDFEQWEKLYKKE